MAGATLRKIRLELARTKEFPEGNPRCGYEFTAPLSKDGHLDFELYRQDKSACRVHRFWEGTEDRGGRFAASRQGSLGILLCARQR